MEGKIVHIELPASDTGRAKGFWGGLVGWEFKSWDGPSEYAMFEGEPGGAIYPGEDAGKGPIVYFGCEDIDAEIAKVRELGGTADDKSPIPEVGWFAHCKDTEGNSFSIFQPDSAVPPMEQ